MINSSFRKEKFHTDCSLEETNRFIVLSNTMNTSKREREEKVQKEREYKKEKKTLRNINHVCSWWVNVDWQMLVYDQEHIKGMDSKFHPEEHFTYEKRKFNQINCFLEQRMSRLTRVRSVWFVVEVEVKVLDYDQIEVLSLYHVLHYQNVEEWHLKLSLYH